jgi:hypothetical protein
LPRPHARGQGHHLVIIPTLYLLETTVNVRY